eukprot:TRINITY_DN8408_c0_g1_i5.p1 TRINITY_DN8408_c0_g1~~TRINITY_DN8408_c0_g1_i5.p1  ORF type:complete len:135 (-),score=13.57 TRINITY_DN8408_c0_g1_i5:694-1098(-)
MAPVIADAASVAAAALQVTPTASSDEVKAAFRRRALETHPDKGGSADEFRRVREAFEVFSRAAESRSIDSAAIVQISKRSSSRGPRAASQRERTPRAQPRKPRHQKAPERKLSPRAQARQMGLFPQRRSFANLF